METKNSLYLNFNGVFTRVQFCVPGSYHSNWYTIHYTDNYPYVGYIKVKDRITGMPKPLVVRVAASNEFMEKCILCN